MDGGFTTLHVGQALERDKVSALSWTQFRAAVLDAVEAGQRVVALFGDTSSVAPAGEVRGDFDLYCVLADTARGLLRVGRTTLRSNSFPSLTPGCPQVHLFEREIAEQYGVLPEGHPWFKPVRFQSSYRPGHDAWGRTPGAAPVVGVTDYYRFVGDEIH